MLTRRQALGGLAAWSAASAAPLILPFPLLGCGSRNGTLQLGMIGTGRMGSGDMANAMSQGLKPEAGARMVAVCDVDDKRSALARGKVEKFYAEQGQAAAPVSVYADFRELLARRDIDAVVISTPDHWHGPIAIAAAKARKHIYLQKPLTYTIPEGRELVAAVRKHRVVFQTGSQQRSSVYFRQVCTITRNGWIGDIERVEVGIPTDSGTADATPMPLPPNLHYNMWLGPAPEAPYTEARVHPQNSKSRPGWLQVERYCLGMITGWGAHMYDIAQWGLGTDADSGPVEIRCTGEFPDRGLFDVHTAFEGEARYANGVQVVSRNGTAGVKFIGKNGWAYCNRGKFECSDPLLLRRKPADGEVKLYESKDHMLDFLVAARQRRDPVCPVEVGHRSNTVCVLHHISMKLGGRAIKWDPKTESITGDPEASARLTVPMRENWSV
jgi:myo-inositol 2-dehydrogenase / D-chiro-inositol 1-dehydrogenase